MANKTGKGGFGENPKNINKKGAPIGSSLNLTNVLKAELEKVPKGEKDTYKLMFIKTLLHKALIAKDLQAIKLIMNYVDGMPKQTLEVSDTSELDELRDKVDKLTQTDANITRLSNAIKNKKKRISKSKKHSKPVQNKKK